MSSGQRKRRGGPLDSRRPWKLMRPTASTLARATGAELIALGENAPEEALHLPGPSSNPADIHVILDDSDDSDDEAPAEVRSLLSHSGVPEVIDLTQDDSDESVDEAPAEVRSLLSHSGVPEVIDLTQDDSESDDEAPAEVRSLLSHSGVPEVIDLTQDDSESVDEAPAEVRSLLSHSGVPEVIDLTQDDSDETDEDGNQGERRSSRPRGQQKSGISRPSRCDPDGARSYNVPSGTVSCPICMDFYSEIVQSGRVIVSTKCGHVFCNYCLSNSLKNASLCPTCREHTAGQYYRLYI